MSGRILVRVYRNLHRNCYSIQAHTRVDFKNAWRVWGYADELVLHDPRFVVKEVGRLMVIKTGNKNVHAWVEGWLETSRPPGSMMEIIEGVPRLSPKVHTKIRYNPKVDKMFNCNGIEPRGVGKVYLTKEGIFV